jgi:ComF family protein
MMQKIDGLMRAALGLLFPLRCASCDEILDADGTFCPACSITLEPIVWSCPLCALPLPATTTNARMPTPCLGCLHRPPRVSGAFAPFEYGGALAEAIKRLKWHDRPDLATRLGHMLADGFVRAGPRFADAELIIPVPLHPRRLRKREFNQAALLADAMMSAMLARARRRDWRLDTTALVRLRDTPPQMGLDRAQRRLNMRGAFAVPKWARARVAKRRVLLVDDVLTTGATADACAVALVDGGASSVVVLTLGKAMT